MKKVISIFVTLVMVFALLCVYVSADESNKYYVGDSYFEYYIVNKHTSNVKSLNGLTALVITKLSDNFSRKLVVPDEIDETKIEYVKIQDYSYLETLVLSDGIKGFACEMPQSGWTNEYVRDTNHIRFIYVGRNFIADGFDSSKTELGQIEKLEYIYVSDDNNEIVSKKGVVYSKDGSTVIKCPENYKSYSLKLKNETIRIDDGAFSNNTKLYRIRGLQNITYYGSTIGTNNLNSIVFPKGMREIGISSYRKNTELEKVVFKSKKFKVIRKYAFSECKKLKKVYINNTKFAPKIKYASFSNTAKGIKFYVKNKTVAKQLKKQLKASGVYNAKIYSGKKLIFKNIK